MVVCKNVEDDVYEIRPATGGETKRVNKRYHILDTWGEVRLEDIKLDGVLPRDQQEAMHFSTGENEETDENSNESDSEDEIASIRAFVNYLEFDTDKNKQPVRQF